MDYSRLSRETLMHEIQKLNHELEIEHLKRRGDDLGIHKILNELAVPMYCIGMDYKILWANAYALNRYKNIEEHKCYQVFFNRSDICKNCQLETIVANKSSNHMIREDDHSSYHIHQLPFYGAHNNRGIIEYFHEKESQLTKEEVLNEALMIKTEENAQLKKELDQKSEFIELFTKAIRTPLRAFNGYFQMNPDHQQQYNQTLKKTSEQLFQIFNKMMVFSQRDRGKFKILDSEFNLIQSVGEVVDQTKLLTDKSIDFEASSTIPQVIIGDELHLKMMLTYIFEWLVMQEKNSPIKCEVAEVQQAHDSIDIRITLRSVHEDADEASHNKTEVFLEAYAARLGLDLAKEIGEAMGSQLRINQGIDHELQVDLNHRFSKMVPINRGDKKREKSTRTKVLIADHDKPNIALDVFERYELYFAKTGREAIDMYFEVQPDILLLNVTIENCDGFEVYDEIERRRKDRLPLIAMSNKLIDNERAFMQDYGFDDYFSKPLTTENFEEIIKRYT